MVEIRGLAQREGLSERDGSDEEKKITCISKGEALGLVLVSVSHMKAWSHPVSITTKLFCRASTTVAFVIRSVARYIKGSYSSSLHLN